MKTKLILFLALLALCGSRVRADVSFKSGTPYLMIQQKTGMYFNMETYNTNPVLSDTWSLVYFTSSEGGYSIGNGTYSLYVSEYHAFSGATTPTVWTISEVAGKANCYKLYQNTSVGNEGYLGTDEFNYGSPCFCDKVENHESTTFIIIEANVYVKLQELLTIPALYSSSDINLATTMIKGSALTTSQQEGILESIYSSAEGKKFYAVNNNLRDNYLTIGESNVSLKSSTLTADAIMEVEYAGDGKYYLKGVVSNKYAGAPADPPSTYSTTSEATAFYVGNYAQTTNNKVYFAKTKTNSNDEALHYNIGYTTWVTNWKYSTDPSQWILTAISDEEYATLSSATEETLNYTLTDENGATYSGTITGTLGAIPTFTGCNGYSLSNPTWNISTKTFTADVSFPFKISSNGKTNYTYIGSYQSSNFYWFAASSTATVVNAKYQSAPTNQSGEIAKYEWSIIPSCTNGAFTFTIKNASTGTYVTSTSTEKKHDTAIVNNPVVSLSNTGTAFTYAAEKQWCLPTTYNNSGTPLYLSLNSSGSNSGLQYIGTWISHSGTKVSYFEPDDFPTLISNLTTTRNTASSYTVGTRIGEFSEASSGAMATALSNANGIINGTSYATATTINSYKTALENAIAGLNLNIPASGPVFMRIRSSYGAKGYMTAANAGGRATFTAATDASTIYLWTSDKKLVAYGNGLAYAEVYQPQANSVNGKEFTVVSAVSGNFGQYSIYSTYSGSVGNVYLYSSGSGNADRNTASDSFKQQNSFTIEAVDEIPVTLSNIEGHGFASFYTPVGISSLPDGVKAYIASVDGDRIRFTNITDIPANTGVILYQPTYTEGAVNLTIGDASSSTTGNVLKGIVASTPLATVKTNLSATNILTMQNDDTKGLGFYQYTGTNLNGFRVFVDSNDAVGVKSFVFDFDDDDATGIVSLLEKTEEGTAIYNIAGQRLSKMQKGINIVNGKKILK